MASKHKITAERRSDAGKGASRRLRRTGKIPAIIYGNNIPPVSLQLDHEDTVLAAKNEWFFSSVLELEVDGQTQPVLIRDWQVHPYKQHILHLDIFRIDEKSEIRVNIPLHFMNQEESPAGKATGVVISHHFTEVEVVCMAADLPEHIEVDLATLEEGDLVHLSDLKLPKGVELVALRQGEEYDQPVVTAREVKVEIEPVEAEGVEGAEGEGEGAEGAAPAADADGAADSGDDDK